VILGLVPDDAGWLGIIRKDEALAEHATVADGEKLEEAMWCT
jgi:hypothetical protein